MKQHLLLVKPPNDLGVEHHSLFGLLCLAGHARAHGISVSIINADADSQWREHLSHDASASVFVGIQAMTTEVAGAIEASDIAHKRHAKVIWGGIHAQLFWEQILADSAIDYVCTGDGETTVTHLMRGTQIEDIPNLAFKSADHILRTKTQWDDPALLYPPAYDLLQDDSSPWMNRRRSEYQGSRGCPHICRFCSNPILHNTVWRCKLPEQVNTDLRHLESSGVEFVEFVDDNPFVKREHMDMVAQALVKRKSKLKWSCNARADYISTHRINLQGLVEGGMSTISVGAESGSQRVLNRIQKGTNVSDITNAASLIADVRIDASFSFFFGIPDETLTDVRETIALFDELKTIMPALRIGVNIYTPYPGCELSNNLVDEPKTLRGWLDPNVRAIYSDRFGGKPWHKDPSFYVKLAHTCGLVYSPSHRYSPAMLNFSARKAAWKWIHNI